MFKASPPKLVIQSPRKVIHNRSHENIAYMHSTHTSRSFAHQHQRRYSSYTTTSMEYHRHASSCRRTLHRSKPNSTRPNQSTWCPVVLSARQTRACRPYSSNSCRASACPPVPTPRCTTTSTLTSRPSSRIPARAPRQSALTMIRR